MLAVLALLADLSGPFEGLEHVRPPNRLSTLWRGLPSPAGHAEAAPVVVLRAPLARRVRIAGGRFVMGSTTQEMHEALTLCAKEPVGTALCQPSGTIAQIVRAEGHAHEVTLSDYLIDATEVTVEHYGRCVSAGACSPPSYAAGDPRFDMPSFPVTHVSWEDAASYCQWAGGRLPTEAEWELAARGHTNRAFPWGNLYNPRLANHGSLSEEPTDARDGFIGLAPVGSFPDGKTETGLYDLAGNASEWVFDWYDRDDQQFGYRRGAQTNPRGPAFGPLGHVVRGGSYRDPGYMLRAAARHPASTASRTIGFRCAADVTP